ncbi:MAG: polysaccharide deacetylase family protein, partial [bacterium]
HKDKKKFREDTYKPQDIGDAAKQVKRILNLFVADEYKSIVLDKIIKRVGFPDVDVSDFYMSPAEIREMHNNGMIIGGHSVSHPIFANLSIEKQREEIKKNFDCLDAMVDGLNAKTFCYPHGLPFTFNEDTISILNEVNCEWSFKVEPKEIKRKDLLDGPQALSRYDCADFVHGEASGSIGPSS